MVPKYTRSPPSELRGLGDGCSGGPGRASGGTVSFGNTLWCEGHGPRDLVDIATRSEEAGFDFAVISDHYHPWLPEQEHSPFAWSVLGAVAHATSSIELATMVT